MTTDLFLHGATVLFFLKRWCAVTTQYVTALWVIKKEKPVALSVALTRRACRAWCRRPVFRAATSCVDYIATYFPGLIIDGEGDVGERVLGVRLDPLRRHSKGENDHLSALCRPVFRFMTQRAATLLC